MKLLNSMYLALILGIFLVNIAFAVELTPDIMQYSNYQKYQMAVMLVIIAITIIVITVAYMFSDKKLVIKSLKDIYNFLRNNLSIFLIGLILSVILLAITISIDSLKPALPSLEDFEGSIMDYQRAAMNYFISTLPLMIVEFIISFLVSIYFAAFFYCFIKNPVVRNSFSNARRFYIRLLLLHILIVAIVALLIVALIVLPFISFIAMLATTSPLLSVILLIILYIVITVAFISIMLKIIFAAPLIVYENKGMIDSVKGSWSLTKGFLLSIFVVSSILSFIYCLLPMIIIFLKSTPTSQYIYNFLIYLLVPIPYTVIAVLYFNMKKEKELLP